MGKVIEGFKESTKMQHEITKERHKTLIKTPADAKVEFKERHEYAKLPPIEKQKIELANLQEQNKKKGK